ncbi:uncharacterized protein LOC110103278 [Dendrobium catenatum]|uniref:uncharacterized protein LOC110103278 n=1 Tax=Dendrobium catenatum TaxID=906689 RepID=UPI0009F416C9|nr:uncharacterized protein LOC110103278 [Dendrobium catenatum]
MNKVFKNLIGLTMEVYVDDILVKSLEKSQHISDLEECFCLLRSYNMRLNPSKCAFRVALGKFLGFMVTHRGIEANPEKIKALRDMLPPRNIKEVQRLNGRIAALSQFLARSGDKYFPFFKVLRGARSLGFQWTDKCQEAYEQLRAYLASPPLLSKPIPWEILYMYMVVSSQAISSVLVQVEDTIQHPVYYISKILSETETRYPLADKIALKATLEYELRLKLPATNNIAEYEALIAGLRLAIDCEVQDLVVHTDSQLVASQANYALQKVPSGICGEHLGGRALAQKVLRQGIYWTTIKQDALELVRKCNRFQLHANLTHLPAIKISTLQSPWPFAQWGIDIMRPFLIATGQRKFIILAVDYFTKWVEAEPLAKITETNAKQFLWKNIICRFGIPAKVITDNGSQFTGRVFTAFCKDLHIQLVHTAVAHHQTNGQTKVTNRTILRGLKTRLDKAGGQWADELPNVLWAYRTTAKTPTGETPYNLCFGTEAVIPVDIGVPSHRV